MKTKEAWVKEYLALLNSDQGLIENAYRLSFVAAIQHDARQQGYTEAAKIVRKQPIHSDFHLGHPEGARMMADKIERKRDNLKLP